MLARLRGTLESLDGHAADLALGPGLAVTVLLPAYLAADLLPLLGHAVTVHTHLYLESHNQGAHLAPRLLGFASPAERQFFELLTTVKGIGPRKALRAMARPAPHIAAAIVRKDARALTELPEIGKRLADTIVLELHQKAAPFADPAHLVSPAADGRPTPAAPPPGPPPGTPEGDAVEALVALGESRDEAAHRVTVAAARAPAGAISADQLLAAVFAGARQSSR
ncbi:MAG: hypothetical protein C0475_07710 [Planctomyces sp.]|nr:hypothetical protein [Planctomyces sp.]MBA4120511.1 hypothetical protein [Isosphaera sp.]